MVVGIRQPLPFKGVRLLLGNDLAGYKVVVNPLVSDTPCIDRSPDPFEQELPDLYPSCAVTRAMAKKAMLTENQSDVDLTDSSCVNHLKMRSLGLFLITCLNTRQTQKTVHQYRIIFLYL